MTNTGKEYEKLVHAIFKAALDIKGLENCEIEHDVDLPGKTRDPQGNPIKHQIDVYWKFDIGGLSYQAVVQAKDWKSRVTKEKVLAFKSVIDDLPGQPRGIMVTSVGYQAGAQMFAQEHGIELYVLQPLSPGASPALKIVNVGAHYDYELQDFQLIFDPDWRSRNEEKITSLLDHLDPGDAVMHLWDGERAGVPVRLFRTVFENIRNTAVLTASDEPIMNWFDAPVAVKSPAMAEPVVLRGVVARMTMSNERPQDLEIDLSKLFSFIVRKVTGNKTFFVDPDFILHEQAVEQGVCDFCTIPVPDDDSNLFYCKRVVAVFKRGDDDIGYPQVFEACNWGACDACGDLIRRGDRQGLYDRAASMMEALYSNDAHVGLKAAHNAFWIGYAGLEPSEYDHNQ